MSTVSSQTFPQLVLDWYDQHARVLPWRLPPNCHEHPDPYKVWLSEIMLQQTTVPHAAPYYSRFLELWPAIEDLAAASIEDVTREWAGLGYYARARNLHKCAQKVAELGKFPDTIAGLQALPGIGPYTSAAIGAIAFALPVTPIDGNIERVMSRVFAISGDGSAKGWAADKREISLKANGLTPHSRPGDFAQAMMDLGSGVCTPKNPNCLICPVVSLCQAKAEGGIEAYPAKPKKKTQPLRIGHAFVALNGDQVLMERRPGRGLLGGMLMPPGSDWLETAHMNVTGQPVSADWERVGGAFHVFTHFRLELTVWRARIECKTPAGLEWVGCSDAISAAPTIGKKILRAALS